MKASRCARIPVMGLTVLSALATTSPAAGQQARAPRPLGGSGTVQAKPVESYLRQQMRTNAIPSIAVAVVREGRTELLAAYGTADLEWETAASPTTAYQLASATKPLTGTAVMLLVEEGQLSLDESIRTYLPDAPPEWDPITVRHLATHRSGISDDLGDTESGTAADATRRLMTLPLVFQPGERGSYGIGGYVVLQHIIERVTGVDFPRFLSERILEPLGMHDTRFDRAAEQGPARTADVVPHRAGIYSVDGDTQRIFWFRFGPAAYTAGGLLSTATDLARWAAALDSGALLSAGSLDRMWEPAGPESPGDRFGIGWVVSRYRGRRTVGHSGGPALADILRFPEEKLTIIVLANQAAMYPYLAQGVADLLLPAPDDAAPPPIPDTEPALTEWIRDLLTGFAHGELPDEPFTDEARAGFLPQVRAFLPPYTRSLGEPTAIRLVAEDRNGTWARAYRVMYQDKPVLWRFELDREGRINSLRPFPQ